jgi:uncharacterized protein (UPF0332 family)
MKVETERLLDKAEHAIRAAEILLDADEGDFAAGRAYYAMFYVAEALLVERGRRFRKHPAFNVEVQQSVRQPLTVFCSRGTSWVGC